MQTLLDRGADVNATDDTNWTALMYAVYLSAKEDLIDEEEELADPEAHRRRVKVVKMLLNKGANVNAKLPNGATALTLAAERGFAEVVRVLLQGGVDVNAKNAALMAASDGDDPELLPDERHLDVVQLLLAKGANANAKDPHGSTALIVACGAGHPGIVRALLEKGANVNATGRNNLTGRYGESALMVASAMGRLEVVEALLRKGAEVNAKGKKDGSTALIMASSHLYPQVVRVLLERGADVNAKNKKGETALDLAQTGEGNVAGEGVPSGSRAEVIILLKRAARSGLPTP